MNLHIIRILCDELGIDFNMESIASKLLLDGGDEFDETTELKHVIDAINDEGDVPWSDLAFGCGELLAFYRCIRIRKTTDEEIVCGLLNIMLLGKALNKGFGDWGFEFEKMLDYLLHVKERVETESLMTVLSIALEGWQEAPE